MKQITFLLILCVILLSASVCDKSEDDTKNTITTQNNTEVSDDNNNTNNDNHNNNNNNNSVKDDFIATGEYTGTYWPTESWKTCSPESVNVNSSQLMEAYSYAANSSLNTFGFLVIKDGYIIGESYFDEYNKSSKFLSYSMAKGFTSALIGIAIDQGYISNTDEYVYHHFDQWNDLNDDDARKKITIEHLLTVTSGLSWWEAWDENYNMINDAFQMGFSGDSVNYVLNKEIVNEPGTVFNYSTGDPALLSGVIKSATGKHALDYAEEVIFSKIGITGAEWTNEDSGYTTTYANMNMTLRDYARFGYLFLNNGLWDNEQIVPETWVEKSVDSHKGLSSHYGYLWWTNLRDYFNDTESIIPEDAYMAWGIYGQHIYIIPSKNLVIVRTGYNEEWGSYPWDDKEFLKHILSAIE